MGDHPSTGLLSFARPAAIGLLLGCTIALASPASAGIANCTADFAAATLPDVATSLAVVNPGSSPPIALSAEDVAATAAMPEYCDIKGTLITGGAADDPAGYGPGTAQFELQLPAVWNGKLVYWGVGGAAGNTASSAGGPDGAEALPLGFATAVSDTGHEGNELDFTSMLGNPIVAIDYFSRATHDMTVSVKAFLPRFYAPAPLEDAYFDGCSNGGRMAMKEAEQFPGDFDGVIAGSPYLAIVANAAGVKAVKAGLAPGAWIPPSLLPVIDRAEYQFCDAADGVVDGLMQNPMKCSAEPVLQSLACNGSNAGQCLSPAQINNLRVYWGPVLDPGGNLVFPGQSFSDLSTAGYETFDSGSTAPSPNSPEPWASNGSPPLGWSLVDTMIKYVEGSLGYDTLDFPVGTTLAGNAITRPGQLARSRITGGIITSQALSLYLAATGPGDASEPSSLAPFLAKGGKIIMYHGLSDPLLSPYRSIQFYQDTARLAGGYSKLQNQYRLFLEPGMGHCSGGAGPNVFETLSKLDDWVANDAAPDAIMATKYTNDDASQPVLRAMPLCKFPEQAQYDGSGPLNAAASWSCSPTDTSMLETGPVGIAAGLPLPH